MGTTPGALAAGAGAAMECFDTREIGKLESKIARRKQ